MYQQGGFQPPGGFGGPPGGFGGPSGAPPFGGHAPAPYHGGGQPERQQDDRYAGKGAKDPVLAVSRWLKARSQKERLYLSIVGGVLALLLLWFVVEDHDTLFILSESVHFLGIGLLAYKLIKKRAAGGLSLRTQELTAAFLLVRLFCSFMMEYDIHTLLDAMTLVGTGWVIFSLRGPLKESYQKDLDSTNPLIVVVPCFLMAIVAHPSTRHFILFRIFWAFCVYLEAVSVLPQLRMMQKAKVVEKFTAHYVFALGLSRFISCAHWILQILDGDKYLWQALGSGLWPVMVLVSEIVQTGILADFCYYYIKSYAQGTGVIHLPAGIVNMSTATAQTLVAGPAAVRAFSSGAVNAPRRLRVTCSAARDEQQLSEQLARRQLLAAAAGGAALLAGGGLATPAAQAVIQGYEPMPALANKDYGKARMTYSDYVQTPSGLQYQDLKPGSGPTPKAGQTCVVDWSGVTIGYYGRPFEARNKAKGGAFTGDEKEFYRFVLGSNTVIPAFEEAVAGMQVGGIRRIIVPVELGYPDNDYNKLGPKPTTFSGKRALGFVLGNQGMIDKTLLFDIELIAIR
ncbi:ER lumen -retaining receptor [Micractinium conductrix]|uniref:peptidylprolyl isomerase n=1 Tax=Micractinium conductrix TaxID=554055 RepID=A0A2P6VPT3_9CHLO|nr:ER lumen -retaining receptor [Micractinium conductrix]|eukprot:PSC76101.1 ER lumen -retaining receptor [Micractinium conductrix]